MNNDSIIKFGSVAIASLLVGYSAGLHKPLEHSTERNYTKNDTAKNVEIYDINKDGISDIIVRDEKRGNFVILSNPIGGYERCDISDPQVDGRHLFYSMFEQGYYTLETGEFTHMSEIPQTKK